MSRRALRKLDPTLDLSAHLRVFEQLPNPLTSEALFGRAAPLEVEVGSGRGLFLCTASAAQPENNFFGIEVADKYARFIAGRLVRQGAKNAIIASADALRIFAEIIPDASLAAVHVYFPDPWWKMRHRKRRVMNEPFLRDVERTLLPGGLLHFWTDVEEYYQSTLALIAACTRLEGPFPVDEKTPEHDFDYRTHFERRMRQHQEAVHRSLFRKTASTGENCA